MEESPIKPKVLDYDDICKMVPFFKGKPKLVNFLFKLLKIDKVNWLHENNYKTPGAPFTKGLLKDLNITVVVENKEILDNLSDEDTQAELDAILDDENSNNPFNNINNFNDLEGEEDED